VLKRGGFVGFEVVVGDGGKRRQRRAFDRGRGLGNLSRSIS